MSEANERKKPDHEIAVDLFKSVSSSAPANVPGQAVLLAYSAKIHGYNLEEFQILIFSGAIPQLVEDINKEHELRGVPEKVDRGRVEEIVQNDFNLAIRLNNTLKIEQLEGLRTKVFAQRGKGLSIDQRVAEINLAIEPLLHPEAYVKSKPQ